MITGHSINVSDYKTSPVAIIDCDKLTDQQYSEIYTDSWQSNIKSSLNLDYIEVRHSSSNSPNKAKIFCFKLFNREFHLDDEGTPLNTDFNYQSFRQEFESLTNIITDPKMDSYSQVTFRNKNQVNSFTSTYSYSYKLWSTKTFKRIIL